MATAKIYTCEQCGKKFKGWPKKSKKRYCTRLCWYKAIDEGKAQIGSRLPKPKS